MNWNSTWPLLGCPLEASGFEPEDVAFGMLVSCPIPHPRKGLHEMKHTSRLQSKNRLGSGSWANVPVENKLHPYPGQHSSLPLLNWVGCFCLRTWAMGSEGFDRARPLRRISRHRLQLSQALLCSLGRGLGTRRGVDRIVPPNGL